MKRKPILLAAAAILVAGGIFVYLNAGDFITRTTEKIASDAIGVPVDIGSIDVSLSEMKVIVHGIKVGNPPKFTQPHSITAKQVDITLKSASQQLIDFKEISVKGSVVYLEVNEHGMNVLALKDLANSKEQKQKAGNQQLKVIIERMFIDATTIHPTVSLMSEDLGTMKMPSLTLNGIGKGKSVTAGDAIVQILNQYLGLVAKQARNTGILKHIPDADDIGEGAKDAVKSIRNLF